MAASAAYRWCPASSSATAEPVVLPPMAAERRMIHDVFLEESMQPAAGSGQDPFTRIAYVSFNPVNRRFEHVSLDSRYPPIMFETSVDDQLGRDDTIVLFVSGFTTPAGFGEIPAGQWASQRRLLIAESAGLHGTHQADVMASAPPWADRYGGTAVATRWPHRVADGTSDFGASPLVLSRLCIS